MRLPDGTSVTHSFAASTTLREVVSWLQSTDPSAGEGTRGAGGWVLSIDACRSHPAIDSCIYFEAECRPSLRLLLMLMPAGGGGGACAAVRTLE